MVSKRSDWRHQLVGSKEAVGALAALGVFGIVINNLDAFAVFGLICVAAGIALVVYKKRKKVAEISRNEEEVQQARERLDTLLYKHEAALASYYNQDRNADLFGNSDESRWIKRIDKFLESQLAPHVPNYSEWRESDVGREAACLVHAFAERAVARQKQATPLARIDAFDLTPIEYERHCAEMLREQGWKVHETPATRDGGADLVAENRGMRLVVQCKRYSHPVGNKAVQEVNSAVRLYNGNAACVVAPSGYTRQAQREATGLSIYLLHHSALPAFAHKLASQVSDAGSGREGHRHTLSP